MPQLTPPADDQLAALDADITQAYRDLKTARARFHLNPSGEAVTECEQAEAHLNGLLERRYALTHPPVPAPRQAPAGSPTSSGTPGTEGAAPLTGAS